MDQNESSGWYAAIVPMMSTDALRMSGRAASLADALEQFLAVYPDADLRCESRRMLRRLRRIAAIHD